MTPIAYKSSSNGDSDTLFLKRKNYLYIFAIAISGAVVAPALYFMGLEQTTASHAAILSIAEMVFTALLAILFFGERIKSLGYVGIISKINYGDLLIVASTFFWGIDNNISKIVSHKINAAKIVQLKSLIGGSLLIAIAIILGIKINLNLDQIPIIILLGVGGFGISIFFFLHSLRRIGTVRSIVILSTSSIFGVIFSIAFLHEQLQVLQVPAILIMMFGIYLVNRKNSDIIS